MKKIIFITILLYSYGCDVPIDELDAPAKPMWIEKSQPDNRIELGIDSDNNTKSGIVLMWYSNSENDLAGYNIYRGQESNGTTIQYGILTEIDIFQKFKYKFLICVLLLNLWPEAESNCRPLVFQTSALPTELSGLMRGRRDSNPRPPA